MRFNFFKARKAQSATEYLMTYGWAILAIAIVGALLYTQVFSANKCGEGASGFPMAGSVSPEGNQYSLTGDTGDITLRLKNSLGEDVIIDEIICDGTTVNIADVTMADGVIQEITAAACKAGATPQGTCYNTVAVSIVYQIGTGTADFKSSGTISGRYA